MAEVLGLGDVARALEHEVLEEVGEAGPARLLVREPTTYQRLMATTGARWSGATITRRPLSSVRWLKLIRGRSVAGGVMEGVGWGTWRIVPSAALDMQQSAC